jgi:hypothetical protein
MLASVAWNLSGELNASLSWDLALGNPLTVDRSWPFRSPMIQDSLNDHQNTIIIGSSGGSARRG